MNSTSLYLKRGFPLFQNRTYASKAEAVACEQGDIDLRIHPATGIVTNHAFEIDRVVYDSDYNNEQSHSPRFQAHMDEVADLVVRYLGSSALIEVGCGKGMFLETLAGRGIGISGFDPTYEGDNPLIRKEYFGPNLQMQGEGLVLRHVLEHIPEPVDFLAKLAGANGSKGLIYIEVPCLDWILDRGVWFDIFYEHVNYFRLSDFQRMFGRVLFAERSFGGQYLSIVADLSTLRVPTVAMPLDWPKGFDGTFSGQAAGGYVWGGASKGVIFSLLRQRAGIPVDGVIDINPAKHGRYLPVTGLKIMSPQEAEKVLPTGAHIHVMNPNYLAEIQSMTDNRYNYESMSQ